MSGRFRGPDTVLLPSRCGTADGKIRVYDANTQRRPWGNSTELSACQLLSRPLFELRVGYKVGIGSSLTNNVGPAFGVDRVTMAQHTCLLASEKCLLADSRSRKFTEAPAGCEAEAFEAGLP